MLYRTVDAIDFALADLPATPQPARVLLTTPEGYEVTDGGSPPGEEHPEPVNLAEAARQWRTVRETYASLGLQVHLVNGVEGQPDQVFCARHALPYYRPDDGTRGVVLRHLPSTEHPPETEPFAHFFGQQSYDLSRSAAPTEPEAMNDVLWHPGRYLLWGGYGPRTAPAALEHLGRLLGAPVLALELTDPAFDHLNACFCILDAGTVLLYPGALGPEGLALVRHFFPRVLEAPAEEARRLFACHAHCPDGEHVLLQAGCRETLRLLRASGFSPVEHETGEFLKGGGSIAALKLMFW